jgi:hypothetical protein
MAKVTMPLMSGTASGKFAKALVFFGWKGTAVVRQLVTPSNPQTGGQGDMRLALGAAGKACKVIAEGSDFIGFARAVTPGGQTWISNLVNYIVKTFLTVGGHPAPATFDSVHDAYAAHTAKAEFDTKGALLGLVEYDVSYKTGDESAEPGFMLYLLAKAACAIQDADNTKFNAVPYTIALGDWTSGNVDTFVLDLSA